MRRDTEPPNLSPTVPHDKQPIQQPKGHRRNDKKVHRRDTVRVIGQEGLPALRRRPSSSRHILGHAGLANVDAEFDQFAVYARCAPQRVGNAHLSDQLPNLGRHSGTAPTSPRLPAPITAETFAMPLHHGIRPAYGKRVFGNSRQTQPRTILSKANNGTRSGLPRRSTMICCRNTRISLPPPRAAGTGRSQAQQSVCRDPTSRRGSSDSASHANRTEFTTGTGHRTGHGLSWLRQPDGKVHGDYRGNPQTAWLEHCLVWQKPQRARLTE